MNIDRVWMQIVAHAGEVFYTKRGIPFTYHISGKRVVLENTNRSIPYGNFETALSMETPSISHFHNLQGPSYLYGIITDRRIVNT